MCQAPIFKSSKSDIYFFVGSFLCFFDKTMEYQNAAVFSIDVNYPNIVLPQYSYFP